MREKTKSNPLLYASGIINSSGGNVVIIAPGAKKQIAIKHIFLQNRTSTENSVLIKFGSTTIIPVLLPTKGDGFTDEFHHCLEVGDNVQVVLDLSSATDIGYCISYWVDQD